MVMGAAAISRRALKGSYPVRAAGYGTSGRLRRCQQPQAATGRSCWM